MNAPAAVEVTDPRRSKAGPRPLGQIIGVTWSFGRPRYLHPLWSAWAVTDVRAGTLIYSADVVEVLMRELTDTRQALRVAEMTIAELQAASSLAHGEHL
jgi:hypothetical protein